jgi:hypothetical protein
MLGRRREVKERSARPRVIGSSSRQSCGGEGLGEQNGVRLGACQGKKAQAERLGRKICVQGGHGGTHTEAKAGGGGEGEEMVCAG